MGMVADDRQHSGRLLESLPTRPPTPPRETVGNELDALPKPLIAPQLDRWRSQQTPPGVPSPSTSSQDSTTRKKRVGFCAEPQYQEPPIFTNRSSKQQQPTPSSLRSNSSPRPVKGILKPSTAPNRLGPSNGVYLDIGKPGKINIAEMLESTLQQLAGADRNSKIDAYTMLWRGLKASSNLPDRIALQEKLGLFVQFIQRDLTLKSPAGTLDSKLVTSAAKLLHTFLQYQGIAASIPKEFSIFLVEYCVRSFEDSNSSKDLIRHLMHALYLQKFSGDVMSFERVGRLVNALHDLENHVPAKSILRSRIQVYDKLVKQCPQQMTVHSDWLQDLFTDMQSNVSDLRDAACRFGLQAALALSKEKRLVAKAISLLNLVLDDKKYVELIAERLNAMLQSRDECLDVPRIWSIVTLLILKPDQWNYFKPWGTIIQVALNHANASVKKEATYAWNRYTYRLFLDRRLERPNNLRFFTKSFLGQLTYRAHRETVLGSIRNYFYYILRPEMDVKLLDDIWDQGVEPIMIQIIGQARSDQGSIDQAASILAGLLDCRTKRTWNDERIANAALVTDEELPALDAKWVRTNAKRIFTLAGPMIEKNFVQLSLSDSPTRKVWIELVQSVASASAKDVKLHDDTANFVAAAFTFLSCVWENGPISSLDGKKCSSVQFLESARDFILILIEGLGLLPNPFTDRPFIRTKDGDYITLSTRTAKHQAAKRPPLHHLFLLFSKLPPAIPDNEAFCSFFESVFAPFFQKKSARAQSDLAHELLRLSPPDACCPYGPWAMCATRLTASLESGDFGVPTSSPESGVTWGSALRDFVKVLERGLRSTPNLPGEMWTGLLHALLSCARNKAGDAGVAIAVVEPLAMVISDLVPNDDEILPLGIIDAAVELIAASTQPRDKQAVDAARRILWGTPNAGTRTISYDTFQHLYSLVAILLQKLYAGIGSYPSEKVLRVLDEVNQFFDRVNPDLLVRTCAAFQDGLVCWLKDEDHLITRVDFPGIAGMIRSLWQRLCTCLIGKCSSNLPLETVEPVLCAAFSSTHKDIVRIAVETWNRIYDDVEHIEYPETLKAVLESLGSSVEITRPGLEVGDGQSNGLRFSESQEQAFNLPTISPNPSTTRQAATPVSEIVGERNVTQDEGGRVTRAKSKGRTPRSKPRHEDSQIQFAHIDSSPALLASESQVLTDRQMEVRERQRETAAMFPEMRSSPTEKTKKARMTNAQCVAPSPSAPQASTPERAGDLDDCVTSTPTPRRGQPVSLPEQDHEMADAPSSPPELRSARLLAELKSQTTRTSNQDDWQFSSSPISGSPNPANDIVSASQPMDLDEVNEDLRLDDPEGATEILDTTANDDTTGRYDSDIVEDTNFFDQVEETTAPTMALMTMVQQPQSSPTGSKPQGSMTEDNFPSANGFADAPGNSLPPTSSPRVTRQHASRPITRSSSTKAVNSPSFAVSASFEDGLHNVGTGRHEIPLRSSQCSSPRKLQHKLSLDKLPESSEKVQESAAEASNNIDVAGSETTKSKRSRSKKKSTRVSASQNSQPAQGSQESQVSQVEFPPPSVHERELPDSQELVNVSPGSGFWWRKRRRSVSSVFSSGGSKKARHNDFLAENRTENMGDEIPDSQPAAVGNQGHEETRMAEELYQNDISFTSSNGPSPDECTAASGGPSAAADEPVQEDPRSDTAAAQIVQDDMILDDDLEDEEAVHSQLVREEIESASRIASPSKASSQPLEPAAEEPAEGVSPHEETPFITQDQEEPVAPAAPKPSNFPSMMRLFRSGLDMLRSVSVSREQFYQAEDVMFDIRRELLEAEKRGASSSQK